MKLRFLNLILENNLELFKKRRENDKKSKIKQQYAALKKQSLLSADDERFIQRRKIRILWYRILVSNEKKVNY